MIKLGAKNKKGEGVFMAGTKPRWQAWESTCIEKAIEHQIQLKVISRALGRTIASVSKKIKNLGLREFSAHRGRVKGVKNQRAWVEKTPFDLAKMKEILKAYAPVTTAQKEGCRLCAPLSSQSRGEGKYLGSVSQGNALFSFTFPLEYILMKEDIPPKLKGQKVFGDPTYVSLCHVEEWAISEGFYRVEQNLRTHGFSYWKGGQYFSKAQLLMYVNRIRLDKKLQPLALYEDLYADYQGC